MFGDLKRCGHIEMGAIWKKDLIMNLLRDFAYTKQQIKVLEH